MIRDQIHFKRCVSVPPGLLPLGEVTGAQGTKGHKVSLGAGTCVSRAEAIELSGRRLNLIPSRSLKGSHAPSGLEVSPHGRSPLPRQGKGTEKGAASRNGIRLGAVALCSCGKNTLASSAPIKRIKGDRRTPVMIGTVKKMMILSSSLLPTHIVQ